MKMLEKYRFNKMELSGALGDIGIFIPIFIALVSINGLNPNVILLAAGLFYICSGFYYNLPMPVQPLKAVAAIAIAGGLSGSVISAAGILMGIFLLFISISGLTGFLSRIFVRPIVKGIQLGVGLMLIKTAAVLIINPLSINGQVKELPLSIGIPVNLLVVIGGAIIMLVFLWKRHLLATIYMLGFGITVSLLGGLSNEISVPLITSQKFNLIIPGINDFIKAFFLLLIPQIPLTLGNAVVATKDTAQRYFGKKAKKVTENSLIVGMGISNIFAGLAGGMPMCHGSGGLTAHHSFGARTGGSSIIIGSLFVGLSIIFGKGVFEIFKLIPYPILGIMLIYIGFRHACMVTDLENKGELAVAIMIGILAVITKNLTIACGIGMVIWYFIKRKKTGRPAKVV